MTPPRSAGAEIIEGIFREGQIITLSADFRMGKSPLLLDWLFSIATGTPWCGRQVLPRPVLLLGHETPDWQFRPDWERLAAQRGVSPPMEPTMFEVFLETGNEDDASTQELLAVLCKGIKERLAWLAAKSRPGLVIATDPFDMFFRIERRSVGIMEVYHFCRMIKRKIAGVTFLFTFNTRKKLRLATEQPSLLDDPQDWLQEASGHLEIQTRSDVRLGIAHHGNPMDGVRILNGVRRGGDTMEPLFLESRVVGEDDNGRPLLAGFQPVPVTMVSLEDLLSPRLQNAYNAVEREFEIEDLVVLGLARSSAYRLVDRLTTVRLVEKVARGRWRKVEGG